MRRLLFTAVLLVAALFLLPVLWPQDISHESAEGAAETPTVSENETVTVQIDGKPTELTLESYVEGVTAAEIHVECFLLTHKKTFSVLHLHRVSKRT